MAKPTREQIDNPHPTRKAILTGNKNDRQYLNELVKVLITWVTNLGQYLILFLEKSRTGVTL